MEHTNSKESSYQVFVDQFDPEKKLGNKDRSALYLACLIKTIVDKGIRVNFRYHSFVHGEEGDSEATLKENRKGAIYFSIYENDLPKDREVDKIQFNYYANQLALVSLKHTKFLNYINKMVLTKYPSNKEWDHDKETDSREIFAEKLSELKYETFVDGKLIARSHNKITLDNFNDFLNIVLTDKLIKEFDKITHPENYKEVIIEEPVITSRFKIK